MSDNEDLVARASTTIDAPVATVWDALVNPDVIRRWMAGTEVVSDWEEGSPIVWKGEWHGTTFEDKGTVLAIDEERMVRYSHFSPMTGQPDVPENYHTVTVELASDGALTVLTLFQDNNDTAEARDHSEKNWQMMLESLKGALEGAPEQG